ncbi:transglutaminase domain-containing protein [Paenibacillus athensensis]|nr:transglutaminase domain-containing protein [Paenibacillus athensensis]MCD1258437.1 transglutaminase domain-containing protein [Paenibacillus athensensis]
MPNRKALFWQRLLLTEWPQRLVAILSGLFLYQYVSWIESENGLWLPQTISAVSMTLLIGVLSFLIPRLRLVWRCVLQLALVVVFVALQVGYHYIGMPWRSFLSLEAVGLWLEANVGQLAPFIWFALGAWAIYLAMIWVARSKLRLYMVLLASVLFFAIRDSFSQIVLWQEVSIVLVCGLLLLVLRHLAELKSRAPLLWETLAEYPTTIGVPVVLILALTFTIGAIAPSVDPLMMDPYTAWRISQGESVPALGKGFIVSQPSGDASSGYSRDDSSLGGSFRFDYSTVMTVDTSKRTYFRGETRSVYTGSGWESGEAEKRQRPFGVGSEALAADPAIDTSLLKTQEVTQTITMEQEAPFPVLFAGFQISKVESLDNGETSASELRWFPQQSELRVAGKHYPKTYQVVVKEPIIDEAGLRAARASYDGDSKWDAYLQLPVTLPPRVRDLAADVTKNAANPYDKAKSIELYLSTTFPYTNTPDMSQAASKDFVDRFLFEVKQGYCDYYSSAMVVMARAAGLPARWVKGYSSGQSPIPEEVQRLGNITQQTSIDADAAGEYTVRNADAHSWAEIYFEGYGWIPFEPTSGFALPSVYPDDQPKPLEELTLPQAAAAEAADAGVPLRVWIWAGSVALVALAAGALLYVRRAALRRMWRKLRLRRARAASFDHKIVIEFERLLRLGRRKGFIRHEHETMREAAARWAQQSKWMKKDLEIALNLFERAKYSPAAATEQDFAQATQTIARLKEQMK